MTASDHGTSENARIAAARPQESEPGQELTEIGEDECFALLQGQRLGRLAIVRDGRPEIFPVNYAMDGRTVTIRTATGVKLTYASLARVAFEAEDIDPVTREGWVVEVRGLAEDITDAGDRWSEHARAAGVDPWVKGKHERYLAISHAQVSGRRLSNATTSE